MSWIMKKLQAAAANQCKTNIRINTKTLVLVGNKVETELHNTLGVGERLSRQVQSEQQELLNDIMLGLSNGLALEEIRSCIDEALTRIEVSKSAQMAVDHVVSTAASEATPS